MNVREEKGVTMIALIITIIVLLILAGIVIQYGGDSIKTTKIENLKTNMLLIEAKAKEYVEKANFYMGVPGKEPSQENKEKALAELSGEGKGTKVETNNETLVSMGITDEDITQGKVYQLATSDLQKMGIQNVTSDEETGYYLLVYNIQEASAEVYFSKGIRVNNEKLYRLEQLKQIEQEL